MTQSTDHPILRRARAETDVGALREAYVLASHGLTPYAWAGMAAESGEAVEAVANRRMRAQIEDPGKIVRIAEWGGRSAGVLVGYPIGAEPEALDGVPATFVPLVELENAAPGTFYVNMLAVFEPFRRQGVGTRLLEAAVSFAEGRPLSLIVSDDNAGAIATYRKFGFETVGRRPMVKGAWDGSGTDWLLMIRA